MPKRLLVLGLGKMGSWFKQKLEKFLDSESDSWTVLGYDIKMGITLSDVVNFEPVDIILNCVSLQDTINAFNDAIRFATSETIFCDIASLKFGLEEYYKKHGLKYVSFHPMFGPTFAKMEQLHGENVIFMKGSDQEALHIFERFFSQFSLNFHYMTFAEHDLMMAYSLTVPFVCSFIFAGCVDKTVVPGTTFMKHLNIVRGLLNEDETLISEILFNPHSVRELERMTSNLEYLKHMIIERDSEELKKFLEKLKKRIEI